MEYNFCADILNKYQQLTPWVQAVLGLGLFATCSMVAYCIMRMWHSLLAPFAKKRPDYVIKEVVVYPETEKQPD